MKFRHLIFTISLFAALLGFAADSYGRNLPSEGDWPRNVIRSDTTIVLTGHVDLLGTITVSTGCTLEIRNDTETLSDGTVEDYKRIQATSAMSDGVSTFDGVGFSFNANRPAMFLVEAGATLKILGKSELTRVTINGGAGTTKHRVLDGKYLVQLETDGKHPTLNGGAICTVGTLIMEHAVIHNVYSEYEGGGILVPRVTNKSLNIKTGPITLTDCTIRDCQAGHGAAIMLKAQNTDLNTDPDECAVTLDRVNIHYCWATNLDEAGVYVTGGGGGMVRTNGGVVSNLILKDVKIRYCRSECFGAGLYWNGHGHANTICRIDNGVFSYNSAKERGGGMVLETSFEFINRVTDVEYNKAGQYGGGIYIMAYNGAMSNQQVAALSMNMGEKLALTGNEAAYGGGVAFTSGDNVTLPAGSTIAVNVNGAKIQNNTATADGGGIYFYNEIVDTKGVGISFNLNSGTISGNHADDGNGGGIFCTYKDATNIQPAELNFNAGTVSNNTAKNGAGIYIDRQTINCLDNGSIMNVTGNTASNDGGGLYISNGGSLVMNACNIATNSASRGGGICIQEGTFNIANGSVTANTSSAEGGGLYVSNSTGATVTVSGGKFSENSASEGGGICVSGARLVMNDGIIEKNTAGNGGGFYLVNNATMDFGNGLIRNNTASAGSATQSFTTGYQATAATLVGMGGGIFLDTGTSLNFTEENNLGLYSNLADFGADDIFANGKNTSITLPDVSNMQLKDFHTPTNDLFWAEDYVAKDSQYAKGTYINKSYTAGGNLPERYRESLRLLHEIYKVPGGQTLKGYTCLALGYGVLFITIEKAGLKEGESAIFTVARKETPTVTFRTIILTGNAAGTPVSKKVALNAGTWIVSETNWSWAYDPDGAKSIEKPILYTSTEEELLFSFSNTENTSAASHDESIVVNVFE